MAQTESRLPVLETEPAETPFTRRTDGRVLRFVRDRGAVRDGERVLVAVSGGPDSTALLLILARLRDRLPMELAVAHFDHMLRSRREAAGDEAFVRALLDDAMARWLVDLGEEWGFEVTGPFAMVYGPATGDVVPVLEVLQGFVERVPDGVRTLGAVGTEGDAGLGSGGSGTSLGA